MGICASTMMMMRIDLIMILCFVIFYGVSHLFSVFLSNFDRSARNLCCYPRIITFLYNLTAQKLYLRRSANPTRAIQYAWPV